jgi:fumarylacetoacetase
MTTLDHTHDVALKSWVTSANLHPEFPIQNLPFGVFSPPGEMPRGGVALGDFIVDLNSLFNSKLLYGEAEIACEACVGPTLNAYLALGSAPRLALRHALVELLSEGAPERVDLLHKAADCRMSMPARVGDYTDFYTGIHHAMNVGKLMRPDNPLLPNYKWIPIGYHGRASSVLPSGVGVRRPSGQRKRPDSDVPDFGPCERLDYELELGIWVGPGNTLGEPISVVAAADHIAGYCLLNDWSARDIQSWEYQPLGPFLSKSFHSTISPWIITPEALLPFRAAQSRRPDGDPQPLEYLLDQADQAAGALDLQLEITVLTQEMARQGLAAFQVARSNALNMYWTAAQLITHHSVNGCNLNPGDLLGSGTISSPLPDGYGSLLELTRGGAAPIHLPSGETRSFLEDGDEVALHAYARRPGFAQIGFGACKATINSSGST